MPKPKPGDHWNAWKTGERDIVIAGIAAGLFARQISTQLVGRSRCAVVGFCHRNGLKLPGKPVADPSEKVRRRRAKARANYVPKRPRPLEPGEEPRPGAMALLDLEDGMCRWPSGTAAPYTFCGQEVYHQSYCLYHSRQAVRPTRDWRSL
jgi:hypothetical protein